MRTSRHQANVLDERAREMRHAPTSSEARLFEAVRGKRLGVSFRRQVPLAGRFIADLYASEVRLVVEVDGLCHADRARADARRDRALERIGCRVLRLEAALVMNDLPAAVERIRREIEVLRGRPASEPPTG
jgi:very-short-patch-repair endonuclease